MQSKIVKKSNQGFYLTNLGDLHQITTMLRYNFNYNDYVMAKETWEGNNGEFMSNWMFFQHFLNKVVKLTRFYPLNFRPF